MNHHLCQNRCRHVCCCWDAAVCVCVCARVHLCNSSVCSFNAHTRRMYPCVSAIDLQPKKLLCKYLTWALCEVFGVHCSTRQRTGSVHVSFITLSYGMFWCVHLTAVCGDSSATKAKPCLWCEEIKMDSGEAEAVSCFWTKLSMTD